MTKLINSFHGTEYTTSKTRSEIDRILGTSPIARTEAERRWVRYIESMLCGISGCTCSDNEIGERRDRS